MKFSYYQHKNIVSTLQTIQKTVKMNSALLYTFTKVILLTMCII